MFSEAWRVLKETVLAFVEDEALTRGAAIAFYTVTSIAPVLLIVIAIAGLAFGHDAAQNAITAQLSDLMGQQTAEILQTAVASAASKPAGIMATIIGLVTLLVTASGVFGEMQTALNVIWKAKPKGTTTSRLIRARAASLGLVASLGFLLMVSLVVSTALTAFGNYLDSLIPFGKVILTILNVTVSLALAHPDSLRRCHSLLHDVTVRSTRTRQCARVEGVPPEEFGAGSHASTGSPGNSTKACWQSRAACAASAGSRHKSRFASIIPTPPAGCVGCSAASATPGSALMTTM